MSYNAIEDENQIKFLRHCLFYYFNRDETAATTKKLICETYV